MTDKRQKAAKVKCKGNESLTKRSIFVEYSLFKSSIAFCWSSFADEHNTSPKSTTRHLKLNKFAFGTPWLPDLLCKHWFTSSVWNFCPWVADVPPRETSFSGDERGETSVVRRLMITLFTRKRCLFFRLVHSGDSFLFVTIFHVWRKAVTYA